MSGTVVTPTGERNWKATRPDLLLLARPGQDWTDADVMTDADRKPKTVTGGTCFIAGATILTVSEAGRIENGDILVHKGKISRVGRKIERPEGVTVIDGRGLFVMPGIIDCHSHIALESVNEGTLSIVPEVRITDVLDPGSVSIFRAAAGGCTTANSLHGSANPVGGQNAVIKMRYRAKPGDLLFGGAPRGVKFALGENPKQSNWGRSGTRFPNTRMGVEAVYRRAFTRAQEYRAKRKEYKWRKNSGEDVLPPRRDLRLEALVDIMEGKIRVHCHCYRADEILMIMRVAEDFGFRIATLQHVLEGYKVAPEMAKHGAGGSTFADWWAYKIEAYDAIPHNAALMTRAGVVASINSDSGDHIRRLNQEAAKAIKYGGLTEEEALKLVTLNPAIQLGIEERVGSIEKGKDADLALYNGHPFSPYSRCVMTIIDGEVVFEDREVPDHTTKSFSPGKRLRREPPPLPKNEKGIYAITNATICPVTSEPLEGTTLVIRDGKIEAIGSDRVIPEGATVIDGTGFFVYPGLIDAGTYLGLTEIGSVRGTRDESEIGDVQPDLVAATAVHADSELIPVARANGITMVLTSSRGGLIAGQASVIHLRGWTREQMTVKRRAGLYVNFPAPPRGRKEKEEKEKKKEGKEEKKESKKEKELRSWFENAKRHDRLVRESKKRGRKAPARDLKLEALVPYATGRALVLFRANDAAAIRAAVKFGEKLNLKYVIVGGDESWKVRSLLKEKGVPVLLGSPFHRPRGKFSRYDAQFRCAARLHKAGVKFAFISEGASNVRNLPYSAATAAAYGLPRDEALKAVTIRPAEILGLAETAGSLEVGKRADLIVTTGDPLEFVTDTVYMFIRGEPVSLESKHTRLYKRYQKRLKDK